MTTQRYNPQYNHQKKGNRAIASRTRLQLARQRPSSIALPTESPPSEQHPQTPITRTDLNDPPPTPQFTHDNSLTGLQYRQRAHLKHSRRCLGNHTRTDSFTRETSDEEDDYWSFDIDAIPHTDSDHVWSTHENEKTNYIYSMHFNTLILYSCDNQDS